MYHFDYNISTPVYFTILVSVSCKCRTVTVKGPRGSLTKSFKHIDMELTRVGKSRIRVDIWFATRKQMACLRTICSHIENLFKGVIYVSELTIFMCGVCTVLCQYNHFTIVQSGHFPLTYLPDTFPYSATQPHTNIFQVSSQ